MLNDKFRVYLLSFDLGKKVSTETGNLRKYKKIGDVLQEIRYPFTPLFEEKKFIGCVFSKVH
jgi:hypothetical protein